MGQKFIKIRVWVVTVSSDRFDAAGIT